MNYLSFLVIIILIIGIGSQEQLPSVNDEDSQNKKLSTYILTILEHYKSEDPVGIPGAPVPDPLPLPPMSQSFGIGNQMHFKNASLHGLKKFRIENIRADIAAMKMKAALHIDKLDVMGNYTLQTWISGAQGLFTVNLTGVYIEALATLEVQRNGSLEAQDIKLDINFQNMGMDFQDLGFFASMFQGMVSSVGSFLFDSIKPYVLAEANTNLRNDINKEVSKIPQKFPNSISPFDQLVSEVRKKVRLMGFDPYKIADYNNSIGIMDVYLTHTWLYGISSFHRTKDIIFEMRNKTVHALLEVGTQRLLGTTHWKTLFLAGVTTNLGTTSFSIEYIKVQINITQSMDTRERPILEDIQIEIGNIQMRFDGLGSIDYLVEFGVNVLPNLIRYQVMNAIEKPIKQKIQEELNKIDVEQVIKENVVRLDTGESFDFDLNQVLNVNF